MYHGEVSFKAKEDLMSPHALQLGYIPGEEQSLLLHICNVANHSSLKIVDGSIGKQRFPIQHWDREPSWGPYLRIASLLGSPLPCLSLFGGFLNLVLAGRKGLSSSDHLLPFWFSLPLQFYRLRGQGR